MNLQVPVPGRVSIDKINLDEWVIEEGPKLYPWQELYPHLSRKPMRLSFSTLNLVHSCPRKFDHLKNKDLNDYDLQFDNAYNNVHLDFGSALGIGIQEYIVTGDLEASIWKMLLSYNFAFETEAKNSLSLVNSLLVFNTSWPKDEWEVVNHKGKPAAELSFKLILDRETGDYFCGYIDAVIRHIIERTAVTVEVKSTGSKAEDLRPLYSNSSQGIGYSIILDAIEDLQGATASWTVLYLVFQFKAQNILPAYHPLPFPKQSRDRLEWLMNLRLEYDQLLTYQKMNYWPKNGNACFSYFKPCAIYGLCDLDNLIQGEEAKIAEEEEWDFIFYLDELIEKELGR